MYIPCIALAWILSKRLLSNISRRFRNRLWNASFPTPFAVVASDNIEPKLCNSVDNLERLISVRVPANMIKILSGKQKKCLKYVVLLTSVSPDTVQRMTNIDNLLQINTKHPKLFHADLLVSFVIGIQICLIAVSVSLVWTLSSVSTGPMAH